MYVCICNAISDRRVRAVIEDGAATVGQVYRACGSQPQCGRCRTTICDMLGERRAASNAAPLGLGLQPALTIAGAMAGGD
ncbi:(2Fe-2S)-binding protein [Oceanibaculum pacificum]|uniref:Bacterioferritin-associated ferredoxin n=1 Tax=Oceanibaculum pacificum TaxID=580166 RepID=A0A154VQA9_9PROT|nr:(2Fe-2S)-binding protein [Oceanibaculum pacificum]KZD03537.1 bacterioferritin-associated ferredoxin-like protein [Oceanibaculum pacificum]